MLPEGAANMEITGKRTAFVLLSMLLLGLMVLFLLHFRLKRITTHFLSDKIPRHIQLDYEKVAINIFTGTLEMQDLTVDIFDSQTLEHRNSIAIDQVVMSGLSYRGYFINKTMEWEDVHVVNPQIAQYPAELEKADRDTGQDEVFEPGNPWLFKTLRIQNGSYARLRKGQARPGTSVGEFNATLEGCRLDLNRIGDVFPLEFHDLTFSLLDYQMVLGDYEALSIGNLTIENKVLVANQLALETKYGKEELSSKIRTERDHIRLKIPGLRIKNPSLGSKDSMVYVAADSVFLERPRLEIYRDKLVADDPNHKKMYGRLLRELPFLLELPRLEVQNGYLEYEEKTDPQAKPGKITFNNLDASLVNLSNTYESPLKTRIIASALFMDDAKVELDWSFDMNDPEGFFVAKGSFTDFNASSINPFLESNMRSRVEGYVNSMYFTVSGNAAKSSGEMKMKYRDLDFVILKEDRSGINKLLTTIGSIFVKQNQNKEAPEFRYGQIEAERDATKSFFNYLWLNVRAGVKNTLTGNGRKDKDAP